MNAERPRLMLYKYVNFKTGIDILKARKFAFGHPSQFNDPFESEVLGSNFYPSQTAPFVEKLTDMCNVVLCLTRNPLNSLMWSHYADSHQGFVFGWDVELAGLTDVEENLLPAQFGNVIYTNTFPLPHLTDPKISFKLRGSQKFDLKHIERLQRYFLYKPTFWSYEEEVRVVRRVRTYLPELEEQDVPKLPTITTEDRRTLHLVPFAKESLLEIYLGIRNNVLNGQDDNSNLLKEWSTSAQLYRCQRIKNSWDMNTIAWNG